MASDKRGRHIYGRALEAHAEIAGIAAGSANDDELPIWTAPFKCRIVGIGICPKTTLTGQATDFTTLSFEAKGSAGTGTDEIATLAYSAGSVSSTAYVFDTYKIALPRRVIAENECVTFKKTDSTATGLASPDLIAVIKYVRA